MYINININKNKCSIPIYYSAKSNNDYLYTVALAYRLVPSDVIVIIALLPLAIDNDALAIMIDGVPDITFAEPELPYIVNADEAVTNIIACAPLIAFVIFKV